MQASATEELQAGAGAETSKNMQADSKEKLQASACSGDKQTVQASTKKKLQEGSFKKANKGSSETMPPSSKEEM